MELVVVLAFVVCVALGSYIQAVTGFAMGMLIMAVLGALGWIALPVLTAVVSLLALVNVSFALKGGLGRIERRLFLAIAGGQLAAIGAGVWLLGWLNGTYQLWLQWLLGLFITLGGLSMLLRPVPRDRLSGTPASVGAGLAGGLMGGLFAAAGPVLGWFVYRQPLALPAIRTTLLACFLVSSATRLLWVGAGGGLTGEVLLYAGVGLPAVLAFTWLGRTLPPPLSEPNLKRCAFGLLLAAGLWMLAEASWHLSR